MSHDLSEAAEHLLIEGTKRFSKAKQADRDVYGRLHGKDDLGAFGRYIDPIFDTPSHIRLISDQLVRVERGEIKRLIINMPPQHGKSTLTSRIFPAWVLGRRPQERIMIASYAASLATGHTRWIRNTCESQEMRDVFPDLHVIQDSRKKSEWLTTKGGHVIGAGARGGLTGKPAGLVIIDDPYKDYQEASSEIIQEAVWEWYVSVVRARIQKEGRIILLHTRWTTRDLTALLLESEGDAAAGGAWTVLRLPALDAKNRPLWPERFSIEDLLERRSLSENLFQALYQQEPMDITERLFDAPVYAEPPKGLKLFAFLDPAFGGKDYSALTIGGVHQPTEDRRDDEIYITYGAIWRGTIDLTYDRVTKICKANEVLRLYYESNQAQIALGEEFKRRGLSVKDVPSTGAKHFRIQNYAKVHWAKIRFSRAVEQPFLTQILNYSELAIHDDAPDSLAGLIRAIGAGATPITERYGKFFGFWRN